MGSHQTTVLAPQWNLPKQPCDSWPHQSSISIVAIIPCENLKLSLGKHRCIFLRSYWTSLIALFVLVKINILYKNYTYMTFKFYYLEIESQQKSLSFWLQNKRGFGDQNKYIMSLQDISAVFLQDHFTSSITSPVNKEMFIELSQERKDMSISHISIWVFVTSINLSSWSWSTYFLRFLHCLITMT